jgi:tetratricopeptide (TPR) repeat protein
LLELGRLQEAREMLREYVRVRPGTEGLKALGDCALAMGEAGEAEVLWRRSLERMNPASPQEKRTAAELCLRLSRQALRRQAGEQSLALAERGLLYEPLALLRAFQGLAFLATGQAARGRAVLQSVLEEHAGSEAAVLAKEALERESP